MRRKRNLSSTFGIQNENGGGGGGGWGNHTYNLQILLGDIHTPFSMPLQIKTFGGKVIEYNFLQYNVLSGFVGYRLSSFGGPSVVELTHCHGNYNNDKPLRASLIISNKCVVASNFLFGFQYLLYPHSHKLYKYAS